MQNAGETYKSDSHIDILICLGPEFWVTSIGPKIFRFGGQFRELRGVQNFDLTEISEFGGRKCHQSKVHT